MQMQLSKKLSYLSFIFAKTQSTNFMSHSGVISRIFIKFRVEIQA